MNGDGINELVLTFKQLHPRSNPSGGFAAPDATSRRVARFGPIAFLECLNLAMSDLRGGCEGGRGEKLDCDLKLG